MCPEPHPTSGWIDAAHRARGVRALETGPVDLLVVGGGITGTGVALDAVSRGLSVVLVERSDLAAGTSRWSSKLAHGGLRYLARGEVGLAWESALERHLLMTAVAPHLARPVPFLVPLSAQTGPAQGLLTEAGLRAADLLRRAAGTSRRLLPAPRRIATAETLSLAPGLAPAGLRGGLVYWDGQLEDDARLVIAVARTAAAFGAHVVTRCAAESIGTDGVRLRDSISGQSLLARPRAVVNATGVWADRLEPRLALRPSRGTHLVVSAEALDRPRAVVTVPVPGHFGRYVFAIPQPDGLVYVGLTDEPAEGTDGENPPVPASDERFLLEVINLALRRPLAPADVVGRFAGLRPLVAGDAGGSADAGRTADLSRRHALMVSEDAGYPVITITGGKLTTYRRMAEQTVDAALGRFGPERWVASRTRSLPLVGAADREVLASVDAPARLVRRYGVEAPVVAGLAAREPWLARPVAEGVPVLGVELLFGMLAEGALDVDDLLARRTRLALVPGWAEAARASAERVLALAGSLPTGSVPARP